MTCLLDIISELDTLEYEEQKLRAKFKSELKSLQDRQESLISQRNQAKAGLDLDKIQQAKCIVRVYGKASTIERHALVREAVSIFASTEKLDTLKTKYLGLKNYAHWTDQRHDGPYGTGPRHGEIAFSIGLHDTARNRPLNAEEREAAVYYLLNLETIQKAQEQS